MSNSSTEKTLTAVVGKFPFDQPISEFVVELAKRGFDGVKTDYLGNRNRLIPPIIQGNDFRLFLCRSSHPTLASSLIIPQKELDVYDDDSGPGFNLYAGKDWEKDKEWFMNDSKLNTKLSGESKRHLNYEGAWSPEGRVKIFGGAAIMVQDYEVGTAPYLVHDNDIGREYDPEGNEPRFFHTQDVFREFKQFFVNKLEELRRR